MTKLVALALLLGGASAAPPDPTEYAATARWMVNTLEWGALTTISTRTDASTVGDPFGNPYSFADVDGVPYFYASDLDATCVDAFTAASANPIAALTLSEAALPAAARTNATDEACVIGAAPFADPENPPCARLVITGELSKVPENSTENTAATQALFARHPSFASYPGDHSFYVAKMDVKELWLIDAYGGAQAVAPADYPGRPYFWQKEKTARWMAAQLTWGVLSTVSTRADGAEVGEAFGNPYAFADADGGVPYFYASALDASIIDALTAPAASPRATLALSEAALAGADAPLSACDISSGKGDPENPPCARLVFSGALVNVTGTAEEAAAKEALFARHPAFASYPTSHGFFVAKLDLDGIWLIDMYGGAADIAPSDYYKA